MGVEMYRDANFLAQGTEQLGRSGGATQAGHILDCEDMGAHFFKLLRFVDVVFQRIFISFRVVDVPGVTDRGLTH